MSEVEMEEETDEVLRKVINEIEEADAEVPYDDPDSDYWVWCGTKREDFINGAITDFVAEGDIERAKKIAEYYGTTLNSAIEEWIKDKSEIYQYLIPSEKEKFYHVKMYQLKQ